MRTRLCTDCRYSLQQDYGYSNYTVEGTHVDCLLQLNPGLPTDRWYGDSPELAYAAHCARFVAGEGIMVEVEDALEKVIRDWEDAELRALGTAWLDRGVPQGFDEF